MIGSVAYNATATLGAAALVRPLAASGLAWPALGAALLPLGLLAVTARGRLARPAGALLIVIYAAWVTAVLLRDRQAHQLGLAEPARMGLAGGLSPACRRSSRTVP